MPGLPPRSFGNRRQARALGKQDMGPSTGPSRHDLHIPRGAVAVPSLPET